jgi:F-type H+-transporting ATPase subunit b
MSINLTLIGQMITFTLLVWFTMKYVWPPLFDALEERKKKIADGLAAADQGNQQLDRAEKKSKDILKDAKSQSAEIINMAQKRASEIVDESRVEAKVEGERLLTSAKSQIEQELQQTREKLGKEVSDLAIKAAEQILQEEIDKTKHQAILKKATAELGKLK